MLEGGDAMEITISINEDSIDDCDKTDEFIRTIYTNFPNARWVGKKPGVYSIFF